jgi:putative transposase
VITHRKRKHSPAEIATKLAQADDLAKHGKLQSEIAKILGVSVMTVHRWRRARTVVKQASAVAQDADSSREVIGDGRARVTELELENSRLRRLLTDLLLEKMALEESTPRSSK